MNESECLLAPAAVASDHLTQLFVFAVLSPSTKQPGLLYQASVRQVTDVFAAVLTAIRKATSSLF